MFGMYNAHERAAQEFSSPPPEADGWYRTSGPEKVVELDAKVMLRAATYRRKFRVVQPGALVAGVESAYAVLEDPGPAVLLDRTYSAAGLTGVRGYSLSAGIIRNAGQWLSVGGLTINCGAMADWSTVPLEGLHGLGDGRLFRRVTAPGWPFKYSEFSKAFGAEGIAAVRVGALAAIMETYSAMNPRRQGETLERAAALPELADFSPRDLRSPLVERIFQNAAAVACGSADLPTLRRLVVRVIGPGLKAEGT